MKVEKFKNKVVFTLNALELKDKSSFVNDLNENMNMYSGGLYTKLRFVLGVVHNGYYQDEKDCVKIVFTTSEKYIDDIQKELQLYVGKFNK